VADDIRDPERDRLSGRLTRFAKVGAGLSGAAVSYGANSLFGGDSADARNAKALRAALGGLKGPLMKAAQMFATVPDLLPPEFAAELAELQTNAPAMGWPFVRRRMAAELGPDWQSGSRASSTRPPPPPRWARSTAPSRPTAAPWP
jgi:predicted unusual protein kinase regulating ubiquinone biosynthesis (AarF/ABC1/UbiB family)